MRAYLRMCVLMYVCILVYVCMQHDYYVFTYVHMYIHTHKIRTVTTRGLRPFSICLTDNGTTSTSSVTSVACILYSGLIKR